MILENNLIRDPLKRAVGEARDSYKILIFLKHIEKRNFENFLFGKNIIKSCLALEGLGLLMTRLTAEASGGGTPELPLPEIGKIAVK